MTMLYIYYSKYTTICHKFIVAIVKCNYTATAKGVDLYPKMPLQHINSLDLKFWDEKLKRKRKKKRVENPQKNLNKYRSKLKKYRPLSQNMIITDRPTRSKHLRWKVIKSWRKKNQ